jgi:peptidoglycan LD-endopeptidase LytH
LFAKLKRILLALGLCVILLGLGAFLALRWYRGNSDSNSRIYDWIVNPDENSDLNTNSFTRCPNAPFIIPSSGFIGLLWGDTAAPYNSLRRHTGLDIFGGGESGAVAVYAVYDGYLSRLDDWRSTVASRPLSTTSVSFPSYSPILPHFSSKLSILGRIATFISSKSASFGSMAQT